MLRWSSSGFDKFFSHVNVCDCIDPSSMNMSAIATIRFDNTHTGDIGCVSTAFGLTAVTTGPSLIVEPIPSRAETPFFYKITAEQVLLRPKFNTTTAYMLGSTIKPSCCVVESSRTAHFLTSLLLFCTKVGAGTHAGWHGSNVKIGKYFRVSDKECCG
jgi:hypothetical protein